MEDLLFLAHRIPYPPNKGDKIRSYNILKYLARSYRVHLGAFVDDPHDMRYRDKVEALCEATCLLPLSPLRGRLRSLTGLFQNKALSLPYFYDHRMQDWIDSRIANTGLQRVFVFSSPMAQYVLGKELSQIRCVVDFVDVDSDKWRQYADRKPWPLSWLYHREATTLLQFERDVAMKFDASLFVSAEEAAFSRQLFPEAAASIHHLENGVDHEYFTPDTDYEDPYAGCRDVLVFTGAMDYWANIDAVRWFAKEVFPRVRAVVEGAEFAIVGARPSREVQALSSLPGVLVTGAVRDIRPYLAHARVAVAPLRVARGIQNKVLEAMAMAKPVLATHAAMEGIVFSDYDALHVADDEQQLAERAIALLHPDKQHAATTARQWVCQRYDWDINLLRLDRLLTTQLEGTGKNLA